MIYHKVRYNCPRELLENDFDDLTDCPEISTECKVKIWNFFKLSKYCLRMPCRRFRALIVHVRMKKSLLQVLQGFGSTYFNSWFSFKNLEITKISNEKLVKSYSDCKRNQRIFTHNRCLADFSKAKEAQEVKELSLKKDMKSGKRYRLHGWHSFCVWHMCQLFALAFIVFFLRKYRLKLTSFKGLVVSL